MPEVTYWLLDIVRDGDPDTTIALGATPDEALRDYGDVRVTRMRRLDTATAVEWLEENPLY